MELNSKGATRLVLLTKRYAFKIPRMSTIRSFLWGMLSNMQERDFSKCEDERLCPVLFSLPMGLLVVMPRLRELTEEEFEDFNEYTWQHPQANVMLIPSESKPSSYGWTSEDKVQAIDYGGPNWYYRKKIYNLRYVAANTTHSINFSK